jgi:acetyl esterase/lipase
MRSYLIFILATFGAFAGYCSDEVVSTTHVYKTIGDINLHLYLYQIPQPATAPPRPAIVFFHGGGWRQGSPKQFVPHCEYFASRGMVTMTVEYRLLEKNTDTAVDCITDARSAMRWARAHAKEFGIDPDRIAAGGGSAGGHLAACTALISAFDDPTEDSSVSADANAMVLFNPGLNVDRIKKKRNFGDHPEKASPQHNIRPGAPPAILMHGTDDKTVPFQEAVDFAEEMKRQGNRCDLIPYEGRGHGFFNYKDGEGKDYADTVRKVDEFLVSVGYLSGKPNE